MKAIYEIELIENSDNLTDFIKLESTLLKGKIYNDLEQHSLSKNALEELWTHITEMKHQYHQIELHVWQILNPAKRFAGNRTAIFYPVQLRCLMQQ